MALVEVRGLGHVYLKGTPMAVRALENVNITVEAGQKVAIVGRTGSGKTTLMQHLNGIIRPQEGQVWVAGRDLRQPQVSIRDMTKVVGLLFQRSEDQIFERVVGDDIAYGPFRQGLSVEEARDRVRWAMAMVGLDFDTFTDRSTFALSGGQKRKVALAGVLALRPQLLVLDEPTVGLDPVAAAEMEQLLDRLNRVEGTTLIFVTHNMDEVARLADYVYVLADGRNLLEGTPRDLFGNPERLETEQIGLPASVRVLWALRQAGLPVDTRAHPPEEAAAEIARVLGTLPRRQATGQGGAVL